MFCFKCTKEWNGEYVFTGGNKFMPQMHLKQPGFTYSICGPFTKKERKNWKVYADRKYRF